MAEYKWTAAELKQLHDRLPVEARPKIIEYGDGVLGKAWITWDTHVVVALKLAVYAHTASAVEWLGECEIGHIDTGWGGEAGGCVVALTPNEECDAHPTLLHALVAACERAKEAGRD